MDSIKSLKNKLAYREKVFATTVSCIGWTGILQKFKNNTLDMLIFDMEHGTLSLETVEGMLRMCRLLGLPSVIRVPDTQYHLITKPIDMGADGVLVPRVETLEQAEKAIESIRFYPEGKKGCGGFSLFKSGETVSDINRNRMLFLQIESPLGIENLDMILDKHGDQVDGIIIGPTDMSIMMGIPLQYNNPELINQIKKIIVVCGTHEKSCGIYCDTTDEISFWRKQGMNIIWSGADIGFLCKSYQELCEFIDYLE